MSSTGNFLRLSRAPLYKPRQLFHGDDAEQGGVQAGVISDGLAQLVGPPGVVHGPDDLRVVATRVGLLDAAVQVVLVVVAGGQ